MMGEAKRTFRIIFFTLFLDLVGFSIIFPMFPALAHYYLRTNPDDFFLKAIFRAAAVIANSEDVSATNSIVLFGGILGALYSLLQFASAPFWGSLSDRIGRKPVLVISVAGLALSYGLWVFSGSFTLLVLARVLGGLMGGNMSTATAAVADITAPENRAKGMAFIGIAFALGFIVGPAIGGLLTLYNPLTHYPKLAHYGINPFSAPALFACLLSLGNCFLVTHFFRETLPGGRSTVPKPAIERSANLIKLFKPLPYRDVNRANLGYFLFLFIFSGMEFTLTFLAVERLHYSPMDNAYMFIYIGLVLSAIQGGVVRRKAHTIGEKKMALIGLGFLIPGLVIIAGTAGTAQLYAGLTCLAIGAAMVIPCLTALVSLHAPKEAQGRVLGIFRSLGSLGRAIGPLAASIVYWRFGSVLPYYLGALLLFFPIVLVVGLRQPREVTH